MKAMRLPALCAVTWGLLAIAGLSQTATAANLTPFKVEQTLSARFPASLLLEAVTHGDVWVIVSIDEQGRLADALVTRYTHRALANEALHVVRHWRYTPALSEGRPVAACAELHFTFEASGAVISLDPLATLASLTAFVPRHNYVAALCRASELDQPITPVRTVAPRVAASPGAGGTAVIEFIIDEQGRPRIPVLVSTSDRELSDQAAAALAQWQFTPPTRRGQPISVQARQEFVFPARS